MEKYRLNRYIALSGYCARRKADEYIAQGLVSVNGNIVKEFNIYVTSEDEVEVEKKKVKLEEYVYIILNKPMGYVTTAKEQFNRPCVLDIICEQKRIYPVGRLDMYSEGMLILTNDGEFTKKVTHPTTHTTKTYEVVVNNEIETEAIKKLETGVDIGEYVTKPAKVKKIAEKTIQITISEGKNRQIRKMLSFLGYKVLKLKRISMGSLMLGDLKTGKYRYLTKEELEKIFA